MVVEKAPEKVADAEMKDVSGGDTGETTKEAAEPVKDPDLLTYEDVKEQLRYIEKTVSSKEPRFMTRAVRAVAQIRKKTNSRVLRKLLLNVYASQPTNLEKEEYLAYLDSGEMETEEATNNAGGVGVKKPVKKAANLVPEVEVYVQLLVLIHLMDKERHDDAIKCADRLMQKIVDLNRRTLDILAAKCYFYYARLVGAVMRFGNVKCKAEYQIFNFAAHWLSAVVIINLGEILICILRFFSYTLKDVLKKNYSQRQIIHCSYD